MVCNFTDKRIQDADKAREDFDIYVSKAMESIKRKLGKEYRIDNSITVNSALNELLEDLDVSLTCGGKNPNASVVEIMHTFETAVKRLNLESKRYSKVREILSEDYLYLHN